MEAYLVLADGELYRGQAVGYRGMATGEVVFCTAMTGYQEMMTDPSYYGQILVFTYPMIGNYGTNEDDYESRMISVRAVVMKELSRTYSGIRGTMTLDEYLFKNGVVGIEGIDTRKLTRRIRNRGAIAGAVVTDGRNIEEAIAKAKEFGSMEGKDMVKFVARKEVGILGDGDILVAVYDYGIKKSIIKNLLSRGMKVMLFPPDCPYEEILGVNPDIVFLSNGPGDPGVLDYAIKNVTELIGRVPIGAICLGHQILGLALGLSTFKLTFGHRGANHPVKDEKSGRVLVTSQNHGFAVRPEGITKDIFPRYFSLNDGTLEGFESENLKLLSVQFHPEASPGPRDALDFFDRLKEFA